LNSCQSIVPEPPRQREFIPADWYERLATDAGRTAFDLRDIRIKDYAKRGIDISNAMPAGGQGLNKKDPEVIKLMNQQMQIIVSMGQFLGEEVLHVMRGMERTDSDIGITLA
jgi:hypothetical protein